MADINALVVQAVPGDGCISGSKSHRSHWCTGISVLPGHLYSWRLLNRDPPLMLGGPGVIVQIDESLFRHKPKVELLYMILMIICCNQIYLIFQNHRGRSPRSQIWVFGMVDVSHTPALGYMQIVPQRDARTLLPIIQQHIRPGTIVRSSSLSTSTRMQRMLEWVARNRGAVYW